MFASAFWGLSPRVTTKDSEGWQVSAPLMTILFTLSKPELKKQNKQTKTTHTHTHTHTNTSADDDSRRWQGWEPNIHFPGWCVRAKLLQSCPTLCDPMDCSPPGSSVHGAFQARILEWVAMPSSIGSSQSRDLVKNKCGSKTKWGRSETLSSLTWWLLVKARKCHGKVLGGDGAKRDLRRRKEKGAPFN